MRAEPGSNDSGRRLAAHWPLGVILALFAGVGLWYSLSTPIFEGADEPAHFDYVRALAGGYRLPVLELGPGGESLNYEASQPPLYYAAAALATFWVDSGDTETLGRENPHRTFDPLALTNRNLFIHTVAEDWPWHGATLAIRLARLVSLFFGAGALVGTYGLARALFPARRELWAGTAAFVAFVPQFVFTANTVSNDSAVVCLTALALWQLARLAGRAGAGSPLHARELATLGLLAALAALAKDSGLALMPFLLLVLAPLLWLRSGPRAAVRGALVVTGAFLLAAGWWYVLRYEALGFWLGNLRYARPLTNPLTLQGLLEQSQEIEISFWGLFGWNIVPLPQIAYDALHWLTALAMAGVCVWLILRRGKGRDSANVMALLAWTLLVLGAFVRWVSATDQPHGRLLFPALPAFALLVCLGLTQLSPPRLRPALMGALACGLLLTSGWAVAFILPAAYPSPVYVAASAPIPNRVDANLSDRVELLGYDWQLQPVGAHNVLSLSVYWKATGPMDTDYSVSVQAFAPDGRRVGQLDTYPFNGMHPTRDWQVGEIVRDEYPLMISANASPVLKLMIGMYDLASGKALQVIRADGTRVGRVTIDGVKWVDVGK